MEKENKREGDRLVDKQADRLSQSQRKYIMH